MKELFSGFRRKETDVPIMKKKRDVYLFGVTHSANVPKEPSLKYINRVMRSDHLLLEGAPTAYGPSEPHDYENTAYELFQYRKKDNEVHFLEEGTDWAGHLLTAGMDTSTTIAYCTYEDLLDVQHTSTNPRSELLDIAKEVPLVYPSLAKDKQQVEKTLSNIHDSLSLRHTSPDVRNSVKGYDVIQTYLASIRDHEDLGPRVQELTESLSGKKAIFVGRYHLPNIEKALNGEAIQHPPPWDEYVKRLPEADRKAVKGFQNMSQGKA